MVLQSLSSSRQDFLVEFLDQSLTLRILGHIAYGSPEQGSQSLRIGICWEIVLHEVLVECSQQELLPLWVLAHESRSGGLLLRQVFLEVAKSEKVDERCQVVGVVEWQT